MTRRGSKSIAALPSPLPSCCSLHSVHDSVKDKPFELELSWLSAATGWRHTHVPADKIAAAEAWAKATIEAEEQGDSDEEED